MAQATIIGHGIPGIKKASRKSEITSNISRKAQLKL